jgi:hypothetical protein
MIVFPTVSMVALRQCPYIYGNFELQCRQSIIPPLIKEEEEEAGELHFAHTGSKGVDYAFAATKPPSVWKCEHRN